MAPATDRSRRKGLRCDPEAAIIGPMASLIEWLRNRFGAAPEGVPEADPAESATEAPDERPTEIGGPKGLEPTRYGDWERGGRAIDF